MRPAATAALGLMLLAPTTLALAQDAKPDPEFRRSTFNAATELVYVDADYSTGGDITLTANDSGTADVDLALAGGSGIDDEEMAPRATIGWRWNHTFGLSYGVQGTGFKYSDHEQQYPTLAPGTTPLPNFATEIETGSIDFSYADAEVAASYTRWGFTIEAEVGKRWGWFDSQAGMEMFGVFTTGNFVNLRLENGSSFRGDGTVWGLSLAYAIPHVPLKVFVATGEAELDGESDSFASVRGTVADAPATPLVGAATVRRNSDETDCEIDEFRAGVRADFGTGRVRSFVRLAYETMDWELDGPPTGGAGFGGTIGTLTINSFSRAGLGKVDTSSISAAIGMTF